MDSLTHMYFAQKLLAIAELPAPACVFSLAPQLDRRPAYVHRMYAHPYSQAAVVTASAAQGWFGYGGCDAVDEWLVNSAVHDRARMESMRSAFENEVGIDLGVTDRSCLAGAIMACVSHTYQDIFNNPMQPYLPYSAAPCGTWTLWESLDGMEFRRRLYHDANIAAFRAEFFGDAMWQTTLDATDMTVCMIRRAAAYAATEVPTSAVEAVLVSLGFDALAAGNGAERFFERHDTLLVRLMREYARAPGTVGVFQRT